MAWNGLPASSTVVLRATAIPVRRAAGGFTDAVLRRRAAGGVINETLEADVRRRGSDRAAESRSAPVRRSARHRCRHRRRLAPSAPRRAACARGVYQLPAGPAVFSVPGIPNRGRSRSVGAVDSRPRSGGRPCSIVPSNIRTMDDSRTSTASQRIFLMALVVAFGALALVLGGGGR